MILTPSKTLIFLREYWCFCSGGRQKAGNHKNLLKSINPINYAKFWWIPWILLKSRIFVVSGALGGPLEALPLLNLCNLLCFVRPGQLGRGQWPRRGISATSKNFSEILGNSRNYWNFLIFQENARFSLKSVPRAPSESLIFLRNYWCLHSWGAAGVENH